MMVFPTLMAVEGVYKIRNINGNFKCIQTEGYAPEHMSNELSLP